VGRKLIPEGPGQPVDRFDLERLARVLAEDAVECELSWDLCSVSNFEVLIGASCT
jgi:hypothetical protein